MTWPFIFFFFFVKGRYESNNLFSKNGCWFRTAVFSSGLSGKVTWIKIKIKIN
ncbi:hypothetical protein Hanom_Chr03g00240981 [Helianthus anomalus]